MALRAKKTQMTSTKITKMTGTKWEMLKTPEEQKRNSYQPSFSRLVSSPHLTISSECNVLAGEQNLTR